MKTVNIFFNGDNIWKVYIDERNSTITLRKYDYVFNKETKKYVESEGRPTWNERKYSRVLLGKDQGKVNFLLVEWSKYNYGCVNGQDTKNFELKNKDSIEKVVSKFGNSYIPYPLMIGKDYTYLLDGRKLMKIHNDDYKKREDLNHLYAYLWEYSWLQKREKNNILAKKDLDKIEKAREWRRKFSSL